MASSISFTEEVVMSSPRRGRYLRCRRNIFCFLFRTLRLKMTTLFSSPAHYISVHCQIEREESHGTACLSAGSDAGCRDCRKHHALRTTRCQTTTNAIALCPSALHGDEVPCRREPRAKCCAGWVRSERHSREAARDPRNRSALTFEPATP